MDLNRRGFLAGVGAVIAAPAIVKFANIMPVKNRLVVLDPPEVGEEWFRRAKLKHPSNAELLRFIREINREFVRENLFSPYMQAELEGSIAAHAMRLDRL